MYRCLMITSIAYRRHDASLISTPTPHPLFGGTTTYPSAGGAICTVLFSLVATHYFTTMDLAGTKYLMACPVVQGVGWTMNQCDIATAGGGLYAAHPLYQWRIGRAFFPPFLQHSLYLSEMQLHAVALAVFASVVAPFGGFFASGECRVAIGMMVVMVSFRGSR